LAKRVIYTCITNSYDNLLPPLAIRDDWDYICFTDNLDEGRNDVWEIRHIPFTSENGILLSRYPKILPHKTLPEYEWSMYMDANLQITGDSFYETVESHIRNDDVLCQVPHLERDCLYDEIRKCYMSGRIPWIRAKKMHDKLIEESFPRHYGLYENNIILRKHGNAEVQEICQMWWDEFSEYPVRDQLSLVHVLWEKRLHPTLLFGEGMNASNFQGIKRFRHPSAFQGRKTPKIIKTFLGKFLA